GGRAGGGRRASGSLEGRRPVAPIHRVPRVGRPHPDSKPPHREGPEVVSLATAALSASVKALALELGFDRVAIGPAAPPEHGAALEAWIGAGYAGTMGYLERRLEERLEHRRVLARAVAGGCVALD